MVSCSNNKRSILYGHLELPLCLGIISVEQSKIVGVVSAYSLLACFIKFVVTFLQTLAVHIVDATVLDQLDSAFANTRSALRAIVHHQ